MKMRLIFAAIISFIAFPALADTADKSMSDADIRAKVQTHMRAIDTNGDGMISR